MTDLPMPLPHRDERHVETGQPCYPLFLARIAAVCEALTALSDTDPRGRESSYYAWPEGGVIGLFNDEMLSDTHPHANLEGWLVPDADVGWYFIARKPEWSEGTPSDREPPATVDPS